MKFLRILLAAGLLTSSAAYAQEDELGYLMSLDIEDLVQVSVASKKEESLYKAPAIVSVVTQEDLRRYGGNNLRDVLNRLPNMQVFGSGFTPNTALSIRGQTLTAAD
ncbi:MAG: TonB-dependent receptor plug domain-containing protein, partial [Pseudomonadota bacterium]|nr:TonB-dependent receptor plug domain-containing protein [Pseudomonadota bacterium]